MTTVEQLEVLIREKEIELQALRSALRTVQRQPGLQASSSEEMRFRDMRPLDAIRIVLANNPNGLPRDQLTDVLIKGGLIHGKKRAHHNVRLSIDINLRIGNLVSVNGFVMLPPDANAS